MTASPTATRAARYEQRMRAAGFVKKHVWVPEEQAGRLEEIAAEMRENIARIGSGRSTKRCTGYAPVGPRSSARACGT